MSSAIRTYGNRSRAKRKTTPDDPDGDSSSGLPKRRRTAASTSTPTRPSSPVGTEKNTSSDDDDSPSVHDTPTRPRTTAQATPSLTALRARPSEWNDLKSPSKAGASTTTTPNPATPTKLSKRMLSRSKTDTSFSSASRSDSTLPSMVDRTSSLPNINPSPSPERSQPTAPSPSRRGIPSLSSFTSIKPSTTRTYAGSYRSFLVAVPQTSQNGEPDSQPTDGLDEELQTPESYLALRSRWGVDSDDEADPKDARDKSLSPTKSQSTASEASPSRPKRPRAKGQTSSSRLQAALIAQGNPLKSITELRNKGENRRFMDEINALFEGMDKSASIGLRRASALELASKYADIDFFRKAKVTDCFVRTWQAFTEPKGDAEPDRVLDLLTVLFTAAMSRHTACLLDLSERSQDESASGPVADKLFELLSHFAGGVDPLRLLEADDANRGTALKNIGLHKRDRSFLPMVHNSVKARREWYSEESMITAPLMISHVLHLLSPAHLSSSHLPELLSSLRRILPPAKMTSLNPPMEHESIYYHLHLLDSYLLHQWSHSDEGQPACGLTESDKGWLIDGLCSLGLTCELKLNQSEGDPTFAQKCLETLSRILLTLTHTEVTWAETFIHSPYAVGFLLRTIHRNGVLFHQQDAQKSARTVKKEETEDEPEDEASSQNEGEQDAARDGLQALDVLSLVLGLLTNVVQKVHGVKTTVRTTRLNPSCAPKTLACATSCKCSSPSSGIDILVNLYAQQRPKAEPDTPTDDLAAEADASFLRGHLAVLFGLLMMQNKENEKAILASLPTLSPPSSSTNTKAQNRAKLNKLVNHARDFVAFYKLVNQRLGTSEGVKDSQVAQSVVHFLGNL